jgi:hypothetical protein
MTVTISFNVDKSTFDFDDVPAAKELLAAKRLTTHFREAFGREYRAHLNEPKVVLSAEDAKMQLFEPGNFYFYPAENVLVFPYKEVKGLKAEIVKIGTATDVTAFVEFLKEADQELDVRMKQAK